ncbi:DUF6702 family protein [Riemerella columbina]|uniref:DUF6702 family protein n=1 Tax=Riemerella columbina TaxID=103810 RepID=UPI00266FA896|nr:DUF6702 family protein [Riemerella columbina]WKS96078.1 hypothetical protein NYR17_04930 [Riemerella columbina]
MLKNQLQYCIILIFILIHQLAFGADKHPYHVGSMDIKYNAKTERFEMIGKFFIDDLEAAVNAESAKSIHFLEPQQQSKTKEILEQYFRNHFKIKVNQKVISYSFLGYEEKSEAVLIYMETEPIKTPQKVEIALSAIYNLYDDQSHIVHITVNGKRQSKKIDYPQRYLYQIF